MGFRNSTGGGITQLTGEVTAGPGQGSQAATIASVITAGSIGGATAVPEITYNDAGQITGIASIAPDDATKIPLATVTAAGDLIVGTGAGAVSRLAIGADGDVLTVASGALEYAAPAAGALTYAALTLAAGVSLVTTGLTTVMTTASLGVGYWLVSVTQAFQNGSTASASAWVELSGGTATYSIIGGSNNGEAIFTEASQYESISFTCILEVTAAGTIVIAGQSAGGTATAQTSGGNVANSSGYTAVKIA